MPNFPGNISNTYLNAWVKLTEDMGRCFLYSTKWLKREAAMATYAGNPGRFGKADIDAVANMVLGFFQEITEINQEFRKRG